MSHLGAFRLEEALQLVVAVALGRHRPELADDRHLGLGLQTVDSDLPTASRRALAASAAAMRPLPTNAVSEDPLAVVERAIRSHPRSISYGRIR